MTEYLDGPAPNPETSKFTPKRVSLQLRHLFWMQLSFNVVVVVVLVMLVGNQNQTYKHITMTQAVAKREIKQEHRQAVQEITQEAQEITKRQEDLTKRQEKILTNMTKEKEKK